MTSVYFYDQNDAMVGELHLEDGEFTKIPENSVLLDTVLSEPVYVQDGTKGDVKDVHSTDDPELFMESLHGHYKSYALRASEAFRDED